MSAPAASTTLRDISAIQLDEDDPSVVANLLRVQSTIAAYHEENGISRMWSNRQRIPMAVVSFVEDESLDSLVTSFFMQMFDPEGFTVTNLKRDSFLFLNGNNIEVSRDPIPNTTCEVLVIIGHGKSGMTGVGSKQNGGRIYSSDTIHTYISHFKPDALILFMCEASHPAPPRSKLMNELLKASVTSLTRPLHIFACSKALYPSDLTHGVVGIFLYQLWAYLSQSGIFAWRTRQQVELLLAQYAEAQPALDDKKKAIEFTEIHAVYVLAHQAVFDAPLLQLPCFSSCYSRLNKSTARVSQLFFREINRLLRSLGRTNALPGIPSGIAFGTSLLEKCIKVCAEKFPDRLLGRLPRLQWFALLQNARGETCHVKLPDTDDPMSWHEGSAPVPVPLAPDAANMDTSD